MHARTFFIRARSKCLGQLVIKPFTILMGSVFFDVVKMNVTVPFLR